ncbi:hypothetical protein ACFQ3Z_04115 [Streptomyces nogalater]
MEAIPDWLCAMLLGAPKDGDFTHPVLSVLRSSGRDEAVARLRADFSEVFSTRLAARLGGPDADLRAELLAAWMLGTSLVLTEIRPRRSGRHRTTSWRSTSARSSKPSSGRRRAME